MSDEENKPGNFDFMKDPVWRLAVKLNSGIFVDGEEVAKFMRANPPKDWPSELSEHIAGLLDGTIKRQNRRPLKSSKNAEANRIQLFYPGVLRVLKGHTSGLPTEFIDAVQLMAANQDSSLAKHEKAKVITSILVFGHGGHVKTVQNTYRAKKV